MYVSSVFLKCLEMRFCACHRIRKYPGLKNICKLRSDIQTLSDNNLPMQRDLLLQVFTGVLIYRNRKREKKKPFKIAGSTDTVTSKQAQLTLIFLKKYLILFVISWKVGLIKGFSIQQLCMSAYLRR